MGLRFDYNGAKKTLVLLRFAFDFWFYNYLDCRPYKHYCEEQTHLFSIIFFPKEKETAFKKKSDAVSFWFYFFNQFYCKLIAFEL